MMKQKFGFDEVNVLNIRKNRIEIGLERPVKIAHVTDVHIALADERDSWLISHAASRTDVFRQWNDTGKSVEQLFREAMEYGAENCDATVITGDAIDFVSERNFEILDSVLAGRDYLFCAGNHEFCPRVGVPDSFFRKRDLWGTVQSHFTGNMDFDSRIVGDVNLITLDNGYYTFTQAQIDFVRAELKRGLPILLFLHVPVDDPPMIMTNFHKYLTPDVYQRELNRKMLDLISFSPEIKGIIAGHIHQFTQKILPCGKPQFTSAGTFSGEISEFEIV